MNLTILDSVKQAEERVKNGGTSWKCRFSADFRVGGKRVRLSERWLECCGISENEIMCMLSAMIGDHPQRALFFGQRIMKLTPIGQKTFYKVTSPLGFVGISK